MFRRATVIGIVWALLSAGQLPFAAYAGEVAQTIVNVETGQGVKIWVPESIFAKRGDKVTLTLVNKLDAEHGFEIAAFKVKEVVDAQKSVTVSFTASTAGIFPIKCHLHPPHVAGQLVVLP